MIGRKRHKEWRRGTLSNLPTYQIDLSISTNHHHYHQALFAIIKIKVDGQPIFWYSFSVCVFLWIKLFNLSRSVTLFIPLICNEPTIFRSKQKLAQWRGMPRFVIGHNSVEEMVHWQQKYDEMMNWWEISAKMKNLKSIFLTTQCDITMRNILSANSCTNIIRPQSKSSIVSWQRCWWPMVMVMMLPLCNVALNNSFKFYIALKSFSAKGLLVKD